MKLGVCFSKYYGEYPPDVNITGVSSKPTTKTFEKDFVAGSCALIGQEDTFSCNVKFGHPPKEILIEESIDTSAPSLTTSCSLPSNPSQNGKL